MAFEGIPLRDLTEADIRNLIVSGVAEHLYLEYKAEQYGDGQGPRRDFLLDICMFANAQGGLLLIGVSEQRDDRGQPTGLPDPAAKLGIEVENPELLLQRYDGQITSCIEERLAIESHAIPVAGGRHVRRPR
jgi:predicted HTH transcriptional regulator